MSKLQHMILGGIITMVGFWSGVLLADLTSNEPIEQHFDTMELQGLQLKGNELEVKPSYGYQTDQYTPIQPADDWTQQDLIKDL